MGNTLLWGTLLWGTLLWGRATPTFWNSMECVPFVTFFRGYIVVFGIKISNIKYFATAKILMLFAISLFLAPKNEK